MDEDVVHIHNGISLSHKKDEIMPSAAAWMDLKIIILSKSDRERSIILYHLYVDSKKMTQMNLFTNRLTEFRNEFVVTKGQR